MAVIMHFNAGYHFLFVHLSTPSGLYHYMEWDLFAEKRQNTKNKAKDGFNW